jgi:arylsulfatase A-like enzyme
VRYVQLFIERQAWDNHTKIATSLRGAAVKTDKPTAALLRDLRQRGLLDDTLVLFTTEFGRTPFTQSAADVVGLGRDHNQYGFTVWMAGAGLKHGITHGQTDEFGYKAIENRVTWPDFHATVLHLLGIDHEQLTFRHNGIDRRLTDVHGRVIDEIDARTASGSARRSRDQWPPGSRRLWRLS